MSKVRSNVEDIRAIEGNTSSISTKVDAAHNHDGTYETADADIVKAPLGVLPVLDGSSLTGLAAVDTTYTFTKTFTAGEEVVYSFPEDIETPGVSVTKEVPSVDLVNNTFDGTGNNYEIENLAFPTTITPSASGDGTFTLGAGSFSALNVGMTIEGNGGKAVLLDTSGNYAVINSFASTNAIPAGSWTMVGLTQSSEGVTSSKYIENTQTTGSLHNWDTVDSDTCVLGNGNVVVVYGYYADSGSTTAVGFQVFSPSGDVVTTHTVIPGSLNAERYSRVYCFPTASAVDQFYIIIRENSTDRPSVGRFTQTGTASLTLTAISDTTFYGSNEDMSSGVELGNGNILLVFYHPNGDLDRELRYGVLTSSLGVVTQGTGIQTVVTSTGFAYKSFVTLDNGNIFMAYRAYDSHKYMVFSNTGSVVTPPVSITPFEETYASRIMATKLLDGNILITCDSESATVSANYPSSYLVMNQNGTIVYPATGFLPDGAPSGRWSTATQLSNGNIIIAYTYGFSVLDSNYNLISHSNTLTYGGSILTPAEPVSAVMGDKVFIAYAETGYSGPCAYTTLKYGVTTAHGVHYAAISSNLSTEYFTDINSITSNETLNGHTVNYLVSVDGRVTWQIMLSGNGNRSVVRNNAGTWEYNSNTAYGAETWTASPTNTEFSALSVAMDVGRNQMPSTQLEAIPDAEYITVTDTLSLAQVLYTDSVSTSPVADGVTINYAAFSDWESAVVGTDYVWKTVDGNEITITALNANTLKTRIL